MVTPRTLLILVCKGQRSRSLGSTSPHHNKLLNISPQRRGLVQCLCLLFIFARTATHVRARESEGMAFVVVVSGTWFESFLHVRACESEGTACVVVVSGSRFESFFYYYYFFARTGMHVRARTSIYNSKYMWKNDRPRPGMKPRSSGKPYQCSAI